jgi:hypothetical protein
MYEMAKRPVPLPDWATTQYGPDPLAWDDAVKQCRAALHIWAVTGPRYYSELVPLVTAIPWPEGAYTNHGQQIGWLLGQVSLAELDVEDDRPVISALVHGVEEGMPSAGSWSLLNELGVPFGPSVDQRLTFWLAEVERCKRAYGTRGTGDGAQDAPTERA